MTYTPTVLQNFDFAVLDVARREIHYINNADLPPTGDGVLSRARDAAGVQRYQCGGVYTFSEFIKDEEQIRGEWGYGDADV